MKFTTPALALLVLSSLGLPASAQSRSEVHFEAGNYGAMVSGTVVGNEYVDYLLGAKAGQEMFVELTVVDSNGDGTIYFNILPPGSSGEAIYVGSMDGNSTVVPLPADGEYTIRVYQMGKDADTCKTTGFNVDLSIQ